MRVPFLDLRSHHEPLQEELQTAIQEVIESGAFAGVLKKRVSAAKEIEEALASVLAFNSVRLLVGGLLDGSSGS